MRTAIAIIERDLRERRFIFAAALALGFVPFMALAVAPSLRTNRQDFVALFSAAQLFFLPLAVAIGLGSSMIGSDLTAGRLSFYLSKPISTRSLWYGKLVAALVTIYVAMVLGAAPGTLYTWNYRFAQWMDRRNVFLAAIIAAPAVLLLAHVLSTMIRSRSAWIALDAIGLAVSAAAVYCILEPLFDAGATYLFIAVLTVLCAATLVALIASGAWHLGRARTDRLANHVELSKYLWSSLAVILAIAGSYIAWITHPSPARVTFEAVYAAPQGPWVAVGGRVPFGQDYRAALLLNLENGKFVRLPWSEFNGGAIAFSRDGRAVAWTHNEILTRSLDPVGEESRTAIRTSPEVLLVMSDDGKRVAYIDGGILNVADATNGHSLASVRVATPSRWFTWMYFATPDVVRLIVSREAPEQRNVPRPNTVDISELDVRTRHFVKTGTFNVMARYLWASATRDGSRLFVHSHRPADPRDAFFVVDARTGSRLQTLTAPRNNGFVSLDDRVLWINRSPQGLELVQETLNGDVSKAIDLGPGDFGYVVAGRGDRVLLSVFERNAARPSGALLVNVRSGAIERMPGVRLTTPHHMWEDDPRIFVTEGPLIAALDKADHIIRINLEDGTVRPVPD